MIKVSKKEVLRLSFVIILALTLLVAILIFAPTRVRKQQLPADVSQIKDKSLRQMPRTLPRITDMQEEASHIIEEETQQQPLKEELSLREVKTLKELPLEEISPEKEKDRQKLPAEPEAALNTQPSLEQMRQLQRRGVLIY